MTSPKSLNSETLQNQACQAINYLTHYYRNIDNYPVQSEVKPGYLREIIPENAPTLPESLENILEDIDKKIVPGLTHWQSPNFFAYYPANASNAGMIGEILCSGLNVVGFNWISSPAATELETIVVDWMGKLLHLPQAFLFSGGGGGVIHGSTCEAIVCTLAAARDRALKKYGEENITKLVVYSSDQTHFSYQKAAKLIGIPPRNFRVLATSSFTDFGLSPIVLREAIESDILQGFIPLYICASIGATSSGAVDPITKLAIIARTFGAWIHVDAAFAGSALICPEYKHYLDGTELVDSISMNTHKWFLTNMECSCLWLQNPNILLDSLSMKPDILKNKATELGEVIDYKDWQIGLSRRFRALKLWIVIRTYGKNYLMSHIRSDITLAKYFESLVKSDNQFELVVPRKFTLVCFRIRPCGNDNADDTMINQKLLDEINSSGKAYMIHAMIGSTFAIRCAIGGTLTEKIHIDNLWRLIKAKARDVMYGIKQENQLLSVL